MMTDWLKALLGALDWKPFTKFLAVWFGWIMSAVTLLHMVQLATFVFTVLQIYILIRDKLPQRDRDQ